MKPTKSKLGNPAAAVAGVKVVEQASTAIPFLIKTFTLLGIGIWAYKTYTNRFIKLKENSSYAPANVSLAQAKGKADSIAASIGWVSNDFDNVSKQLAGLNYNGFVRVYNAFGEHGGTLLKGQLNLIEWIKDQFTSYQVQQLSFLLGGAFF